MLSDKKICDLCSGGYQKDECLTEPKNCGLFKWLKSVEKATLEELAKDGELLTPFELSDTWLKASSRYNKKVKSMLQNDGGRFREIQEETSKAQHIKDNTRHALEIQKLQGEIERLKKEISVIEFAAKSGLGHTLDQAVSEAVKAERKRIRGLSKCTVQDSDCFTGDRDSTGGIVNLSTVYYLVPESALQR